MKSETFHDSEMGVWQAGGLLQKVAALHWR